MVPGLIFSVIYTASTPRSSRIRAYRLPLRLHTLLSRLLSPLVDPAGSAPPRRADRVLPGEISESAAQTAARLQALARSVRAQTEIQEQTRRQVAEELATRRNLSQALQVLQRGISDATTRTEDGAAAAAPSTRDTQAVPAATSHTGVGEPTSISAPTSPTTQRDASLTTPRRSRFGLGGWVARAGEAVGIRTESPLPGVVDNEQPLVAPSQQEIDTIVNMFPNLSRDAVVRALQRSCDIMTSNSVWCSAEIYHDVTEARSAKISGFGARV
ncbi:hypothetical protein QFC22_003162 [Naganishia vaughanmartiniae]|uniref:Uncharacterized protein n=1 Tax=Naganishia vaughanmartiniae TaxID=1424756 RepID=A0ACC2X8M3_9TREE|nr:hypothetical protein QFC22_003162 [Naganishia vaughanmartiniae]